MSSGIAFAALLVSLSWTNGPSDTAPSSPAADQSAPSIESKPHLPQLPVVRPLGDHVAEPSTDEGTKNNRLRIVFTEPLEFVRGDERSDLATTARVVFLEDMRLEIENNGNFELHYRVEVPPTDVLIRMTLQLPYGPTDAVDGVAACTTLTVPTIRIRASTSNGNESSRPTQVHTVSYRGNSVRLEQVYGTGMRGCLKCQGTSPDWLVPELLPTKPCGCAPLPSPERTIQVTIGTVPR